MGSKVAIKKFRNEDNNSHKAFLSEVDILMSFKGHPNIILFHGAFKQGPYSYIVIDYAKYSNLQSFIKKVKSGKHSNLKDALHVNNKLRWCI